MAEPRHKVAVVCDQQQIGGWTDYDISSSMIEPSDSFTLTRPFSEESWKILRRDARIRVFIDDAPIMDGFIDGRTKHSRDGTLEVRGRDRCGRLVQESAPAINYEGLELTQAILRLAEPWFSKVTLSDARNRKIRTGKSRRIPAGNEPLVVKRSARGGSGRVQPGEMRWKVIEELVSQAGLICWSAADGKELFVGKPNGDQAVSFLIRKATDPGSQSTCLDLVLAEDNGDRYSLIACVGTGGGTEQDFGVSVSSRRAVAVDAPDDPNGDGTGRDFQYPKRLMMPEKNYDSNGDADRVAVREMIRRNFRRTTVTAEMPFHGQWLGAPRATLFAPNTVANVVDEDFRPFFDENFLIYACHYKRSIGGETTSLEMVPADTEIVL